MQTAVALSGRFRPVQINAALRLHDQTRRLKFVGYGHQAALCAGLIAPVCRSIRKGFPFRTVCPEHQLTVPDLQITAARIRAAAVRRERSCIGIINNFVKKALRSIPLRHRKNLAGKLLQRAGFHDGCRRCQCRKLRQNHLSGNCCRKSDTAYAFCSHIHLSPNFAGQSAVFAADQL